MFECFWAPTRSTKDKEVMPSGGSGDTPSCSPIRALTALGRRALSPRAVRALRPASGEPILQIDRDQNPQPTARQLGPGSADQQVNMISIHAGGPGEGQRYVPYQQQPQPPTSDAESGMGSATTQTCEGTPIGD